MTEDLEFGVSNCQMNKTVNGVVYGYILLGRCKSRCKGLIKLKFKKEPVDI